MSRRFALLLAIPLVACTTKQPPYQTVKLPQTWRGQSVNSSATPYTAKWWTALNDASLNQLIDKAILANSDIAQAAARMLQIRSQLNAAKANLLPSVTAGAGVDRVKIPMQWIQDSLGLGQDNGIKPQQTWPYIGFSLDYELDLLGRLSKARESVEKQVLITEFEQQHIKRLVIFETVKAYANLRSAQQQLILAEQRLALHEKQAQLAEHAIKTGVADWRILNSAKIDAQQAKLSKAQLEQAVNLAIAQIALLCSSSSEQINLATLPGNDDYGDSLKVEADVPASVVERRADVQAAWQQLLISVNDSELARLERFPRLTLTGMLGLASSGFSGWFAKDALGWIFGVASSFPVFDGGRNQARQDHAKAIEQEQFIAYRKTVYTALADVETALAEWRTMQAELTARREQLTLQQLNETKQALAAGAGKSTRFSELNAQLMLVNAKNDMTDANYRKLIAYAALQKALAY
ncbi:MAG: TolC family protein [Methylobacter sp.]|nr:MAG: TolC family protein [Methylobacter sp.]